MAGRGRLRALVPGEAGRFPPSPPGWIGEAGRRESLPPSRQPLQRPEAHIPAGGAAWAHARNPRPPRTPPGIDGQGGCRPLGSATGGGRGGGSASLAGCHAGSLGGVSGEGLRGGPPSLPPVRSPRPDSVRRRRRGAGPRQRRGRRLCGSGRRREAAGWRAGLWPVDSLAGSLAGWAPGSRSAVERAWSSVQGSASVSWAAAPPPTAAAEPSRVGGGLPRLASGGCGRRSSSSGRERGGLRGSSRPVLPPPPAASALRWRRGNPALRHLLLALQPRIGRTGRAIGGFWASRCAPFLRPGRLPRRDGAPGGARRDQCRLPGASGVGVFPGNRDISGKERGSPSYTPVALEALPPLLVILYVNA